MSGIFGNRYGSRAEDYALHRAGFPSEAIDRLVAGGVGIPGQRIVDLGCGTGTLARQLAERGCIVTGLDSDDRMLAFGRSLASEAGLTLDWRLASAEETGLGAGEFDVVTACQCWHWFDGPAAANEARRVLSPDGRVVVCGFDWLPLPQSVAGLTEELIEAYNPAWDLGGVRDPAPLVETDLASVGMRVSERFVWDLEIVYRSESWYRRIGASAGILSLTSKEVGAFGRELIEVLTERFGSGDLKVPHRVWGLISAPVG